MAQIMSTPLGIPSTVRGTAGKPSPDSEVLVDGQRLNVVSYVHAVEVILDELSRNGASFMVATLNLFHLVLRRSDAAFKAAYDKARFVTADGFPIVMLARFNEFTVERTAGSDLVVPLARAAAKAQHGIFLFGSSENTLAKASRRLVAEIPGLKIVDMVSPVYGFDPASPSAVEFAKRIGASGARICFVALPAPIQEEFCALALSQAKGMAFVGVGASLDFLSGEQRRAPRLVQSLCLEWAWRFALNPRRLWYRYWRCAVLFVVLLYEEFARRLKRAPDAR